MFNLATQPFGPTKGEYYMRLYMFQESSMGRIIVIGGKKTTQKADIVRFRRIKERYIQNNI